jgi:hypothetical protein
MASHRKKEGGAVSPSLVSLRERRLSLAGATRVRSLRQDTLVGAVGGALQPQTATVRADVGAQTPIITVLPSAQWIASVVQTYLVPAKWNEPLRQATRDELLMALYHAGLLEDLSASKPQPDTPEEVRERQHLAEVLGRGMPLSEIVKEGRGPF